MYINYLSITFKSKLECYTSVFLLPYDVNWKVKKRGRRTLARPGTIPCGVAGGTDLGPSEDHTTRVSVGNRCSKERE